MDCCAALLAAGPVPPALWFGILIHAIRAWPFLGYWPTYHHPDPISFPTWLAASQTVEIAAFVGLAVLLVVTSRD